MIHTKKTVNRGDLQRVSLTRPESARGYWEGIHHDDLLKTAEEVMESLKWTVHTFHIALNGKQTDMAASCVVEIPKVKKPTDTDLFLGVINSNDQSFSLRFYGGLYDYTYDAGMPFAAWRGGKNTQRGHTLLPDKIADILEEYKQWVPKWVAKKQQLEETRYSYEVCWERLQMAGEEGWLPWSRVGACATIIRQEQEVSAWRFLCYYTQQVYKAPPLKQMQAIHNMLYNI